MLRIPIILDVIATDGDEEDKEFLEDLGLSSLYDEPTFPIIFYHIEHIHEDARSKDKEPLSVVFSGGEQYIVKHSLAELIKIIAKANI
jgi:hypothetical protein